MDIGNVKKIAPKTLKCFDSLASYFPLAIRALLKNHFEWVINRNFDLDLVELLLANKLDHVAEEKLTTPPSYIAVPTLQAICYCVDCDELRHMFASLLACAMNLDTQQKAHPAYVEMIKQLSPLDAHVINCIFRDNISSYPTLKLRYQEKHSTDVNFGTIKITTTETTGFDVFDNLTYFHSLEGNNMTDISLSIINLSRLGFLDVYSNVVFADESAYLNILKTDLLNQVLQTFEGKITNIPNYTLIFKKSLFRVTNLFIAFCNACLN